MIGYSCVAVVVLGLIINMSMLIITPIKSCKKSCKVKKHKKKAKIATLATKNLNMAHGYGKRRSEARRAAQAHVLNFVANVVEVKKEKEQMERDEQLAI